MRDGGGNKTMMKGAMNPTKSLMFLQSQQQQQRKKPRPAPERRRKKVRAGGSNHKSLLTLANTGSDEIASELETNPLVFSEGDDDIVSESDDEEGLSPEALLSQLNHPAAVVVEDDMDDADRAMDSLDQMSVDDLLRLKREFIKADSDGSGELDIEEFCATVQALFGRSDQEFLTQLFMKIDANSDGSVSYDEFLSFMLLAQNGATRMENEASQNKLAECKITELHKSAFSHEMPVGSITVVPENDTYITVGRDGTFSAWTRGMLKFCSSMKTGSMATNVAYMAGLRRLVIANADYTISFYDSSTFKLDKKLPVATLPLCVCAWMEKDRDFFAYGDELGKAHIFSHKKLELSLHKDWITKMEYNHDLGALVTASADGTVKITEVVNRAQTKMTLKGHQRGVNGFGWCSHMDVLATCGLERHLNVYNPGYPAPIFRLYGHTAQVVDVVPGGQTQLISLDAEQVIKVWDVRTMACIQSIAAFKNEVSLNAFSIAFDDQSGCLVVGDYGCIKWPVAMNPVASGTSHDSPISAMVYNEAFSIVISCDESSTVRVWDITTGKPTYFFAEAHGTAKINAAALDNLGRRLVTGAQDGTVKVWNFSTGVCLQNCIPTAPGEVTGVIYARDPLLKAVVAGGWSRKITLWPDIADDTREGIEATQEMAGQQDDILCLCLAPPHSVASGAYDGTIVIHNILSGITKHTFRIAGLERLPVNERAIEKLVFLQNKPHQPLFSYSADGRLRLWNVSRANPQVVLDMEARLPGDPGTKPADLSCLSVDKQNNLLLSGDSAGWVAVRDISSLDATNVQTVQTVSVTSIFNAHTEAVTGIEYAANHGGVLITASADTSLRIWTMQGAPLGTFGSKTWDSKSLAEGLQTPEPASSTFMTGVPPEESSKPKEPKKKEEARAKEEPADKLPAISGSRSARDRGVNRVQRADDTVAAFCVHRDRQRDGPMYKPNILKAHKCDDIPYLQRHMKVGVPFLPNKPRRAAHK